MAGKATGARTAERKRKLEQQRMVCDIKRLLAFAEAGELETILVAASFRDRRAAVSIEGSSDGTWQIVGVVFDELVRQYSYGKRRR